jgi:hypothetical protein
MQQITKTETTHDRTEATVFCGSLEEAKKIERHLANLFSDRDLIDTPATVMAEGTRPGDNLWQFRVDHTGRETWISNAFENRVRYGPENCELVRPSAVDLGDLVLRLFGEIWHVCRVVYRSSGTSGIDLKIVSISDPSKRESSYYPFREDSTLTRVSFR